MFDFFLKVYKYPYMYSLIFLQLNCMNCFLSNESWDTHLINTCLINTLKICLICERCVCERDKEQLL